MHDGIVHPALSIGFAARQEVALLMCSWTLKPFAELKRCVKEGSHKSWLLETLRTQTLDSFKRTIAPRRQQQERHRMSGTRTHRGARTQDHKVKTLCLPAELGAINTRLEPLLEQDGADVRNQTFSVSSGQQIDLRHKPSRWNKPERTILLARHRAVDTYSPEL